MKHLLNGVAIAAALTIAAPVWAQTTTAPTTPSSAPRSAAAAPAEPMASGARHKVRAHRTGRGHHVVMRRGAARERASSDNIANQLNAQELGRVESGGPPATGNAGVNRYGQPNQVQGIPGSNQPSASPNAPSGPGPAYVSGQYQSSPSPNAPSGPGPAYVPGQYQASPSPNAPSPTR